MQRKAAVTLVSASNSGVSGKLYLTESSLGVLITGSIDGLASGQHGFHVHEFGNLGDNCKNAGGHFNPHSVTI